MDLRVPLARLALAAALLCAAPVAAGVFSVGSDPVFGPPGGTTAPELLLEFSGDGASSGVQVDYRFDAAVFAASPASLANASCVLVAPTTVRLIALTLDGTPLPAAATAYCAITFAVAPDAPLGSYAISAVPGSSLCAQGGVPVAPCAALDGPDALVVALDGALFGDGFE